MTAQRCAASEPLAREGGLLLENRESRLVLEQVLLTLPGKAGKRGDLPAVQYTQFGEPGDERERRKFPNTGHPTQYVWLGSVLPRRLTLAPHFPL